MSEVRSMSDQCCFILLKPKNGRKKDISKKDHFSSTKDKIEVLPGTLLVRVKQATSCESILETLDSDKTILVTCQKDEIKNISSNDVDLLKPITNCRERLQVFQNKGWLEEGHSLKIGDQVFVKLNSDQEELCGNLKYRGSNYSDSKGIIFGVELQENRGNSDGIFKKTRFFKTEQDHAIFVPLHRIRRYKESWHKNVEKMMQSDMDCKLHVGERVVWMSDDGPQKGTVRWIGSLPGESSENKTVGVEFDNPVGTGTGKYKDQRLFYTKPGHASLIPILGLLKLEDIENPSDAYLDGGGGQVDLQELTKQQHRVSTKESKPAYGHHKFDGAVSKQIGASSTFNLYNTHDLDMGNQGIDSGGVRNPLYEHSKRQEEFGAAPDSRRSASSANFSREADPDLSVGSLVQVNTKIPQYGVIRWIGDHDGSGKKTAGLEMEEEIAAATDGTFKGVRYFTCAPRKALFVPLRICTKDKRFLDQNKKNVTELGGPPTPDVPGDVPPPYIETEDDFLNICGKYRGIQGHHNSCYLDATLFCMFYFTTVFDFIFNRPARNDDLPEYPKVQQVLRDGIVNPLRKNNYVGANNVCKLRSLLDQLGTVEGMMGEEKDPEEFLSALLTEIMKADPLLHLSSGEHTYFYQLFMEKDEKLLLPTTQKLVELSFLQGNVKLKEVPSCLMIQMPRFGKDYKMFHRIVPSLQLDITDILENCPRECIVCGGLATHECKDCYQVHGPGLNTTAFCDKCVKRSHQHMSRRNHHPQPITTEENFLPYYESMKAEALKMAELKGEVDPADITVSLPRETMELFAVICIQTSHYVSFVKCGMGKDSKWVFFDSMADRMGEQSGYNIPEVVPVPELSNWLAESNLPSLLQKGDDKDLPEHLRRILCDGYMCMYQNPNVLMYN